MRPLTVGTLQSLAMKQSKRKRRSSSLFIRREQYSQELGLVADLAFVAIREKYWDRLTARAA